MDINTFYQVLSIQNSIQDEERKETERQTKSIKTPSLNNYKSYIKKEL